MAISVNWGTRVITIPQADLADLGGGVYELDVDWFRLQLKDQEDSEEGITFPDTHRHNTEVTLAGATYARTVEVINGYTVTFEDGQYAVNAVGANHNLMDVMNVNQVSLRTANSAGLIVVVQGSGVTQQDKADIADLVWTELLADHEDEQGSMAEALTHIRGLTGENVAWSSMTFDANHNLTGAVLTQYTDNTLVTPRKAWVLAASYNGDSELTAYQLAAS